eukprot:264904-Pelagomonas_calceolata.AAC.4
MVFECWASCAYIKLTQCRISSIERVPVGLAQCTLYTGRGTFVFYESLGRELSDNLKQVAKQQGVTQLPMQCAPSLPNTQPGGCCLLGCADVQQTKFIFCSLLGQEPSQSCITAQQRCSSSFHAFRGSVCSD